jgi:Bacterial regulatory helix-turn-helix protein, lysR family
MSGGHLPSKAHNQKLSDSALPLRALIMGHFVMRNETFHRTNPRIAINQLRYTVTAAEYGSFRKAAEILNVKQSTLSRSIRLLEHETSVMIFNRSNSIGCWQQNHSTGAGRAGANRCAWFAQQLNRGGTRKTVYRFLHFTVRRQLARCSSRVSAQAPTNKNQDA